RIGQGVSRLTAPIPMCDRLCTSVTIFGLEPIRLTDTDAQVACNILFREMAVDPFFNDHNAFQFVLCQGDLLLAHTDIFSDQLHPDNITEQRHETFCQLSDATGMIALSFSRPAGGHVRRNERNSDRSPPCTFKKSLT